MRHLLLLRHAKAERDGPQRDRDRQLTDRGRRDAARMGRFLTAAEMVPDLVLTSSAARAEATAEIALEAGGWSCALRRIPAFYDASPGEVLEAVRASGGGPTLLVVGHEPTWSATAVILIGGGSLRLPTAGLAHVHFELEDWSEVAPGRGVLRGLVTPGMLRGPRRVD
jgi:phosphohistidine phosphatase